ncbi:hypothetical protein P8F81_03510 [Kosakonia cowanii]|uniref:hypothetical protein n=1 Tax=Kosakonia cowanii TaxID=208223 RepID=UPI002DDCA175|nr:hypothetical protein [Kosakonia cowanii]WRY60097.1 hypothetical protein P8F81_03510 [Kosakonia cowanii]
MIDWTKLKKADEIAETAWQQQRDAVASQRLAAYRAESDQLKTEADYNAIADGVAPDYTAWIAKVKEIKARYPMPVKKPGS